jgi:GT2 family glycosyltransferase
MKQMDQPLVSVVMVTRNVQRYLPESIESILKQTFREFEFVVVDFGSSDRSKEIITSYARQDERILYREIPDCSLASARNAACSLAKGRYIAIQDADDVSLADRLAIEVAFLENHPEIGLVGGEIQRIDENGLSLKTINDLPREDSDIRREMEKWNPFWQPTVLIRRDAFLEVGGYRELPQAEDYDLWLRISEHCKCANLKQVLVNYRIHSTQMSVRGRKVQILYALAARASASMRRRGKRDPLGSGGELAVALEEMETGPAVQQEAIAEGYSFWVNQLFVAGEYSSVGVAAWEMFEEYSGGRIGRRLASDIQFVAARAEWRRYRAWSSLRFLFRAVLIRPKLLVRPIKRLLVWPRQNNHRPSGQGDPG